MKRLLAFLLLAALLLPAMAAARPLRPDDMALPAGFTIEAAVTDLAAPTMVAFDDQGRMLIAESGYGAGGEAKITRVAQDGKKTVLAPGSAFGDAIPITAVAFHNGQIYVVHAGTVSIVAAGGTVRDIITGLPGQGDHQADQIVFKDNALYLSIGTVTNAAVVGTDNAVFGWLKKPQNRQLHDVPCQDITLTDQVFESDNPLGSDPAKVRTSAYAPFGTVLPAGSVVKGDPKCNGAVLRAGLDGTNLQVVAWGLRNPYGLEIGPDGALYVTMHGFDARGSRNVENAWDCFYKITDGAWYGWPDFACGVPVTDAQFKTKDKPQPQFLLAQHPTAAPLAPIAKFNPHAATNGFAFAPAGSSAWGKPTDAFIALFGDLTPATGTVTEPQGVKIVRLDTTTGAVSDFITNKEPGQASRHSAGGLEHPSDVTFGPDGAMYITDWGLARVSAEGLKLEANSGVIWKVTRGTATSVPGGPSLWITLLGTLALAAGTVLAGWGRTPRARPLAGAGAGAGAGLVMGAFTMFVADPMLDLPWYTAPRVLATLVMGRAAIANILEFELVSFVVGVLVLLALTALLGALFAGLLRTACPWRVVVAGLLFGLTGWAALQYVVLPVIQPLVTEKGFPPSWYAGSFAVYGLGLGALLAYWQSRRLPARP